MKGKRAKRAQEEMFGFILVLVVIAFIAIIGLGFLLRKQPKAYEEQTQEILAKNAMNFLFTLLHLDASTCSHGLELSDILSKCSSLGGSGGICSDGTDYCDWLNETIRKVTLAVLPKTDEQFETERFKGYNLSILIPQPSGNYQLWQSWHQGIPESEARNLIEKTQTVQVGLFNYAVLRLAFCY